MPKKKVHGRCRISLETPQQVEEFVQKLNSDGSIDKYFLENFDGTARVDARSYLGAVYASADFGGQIFLVNDTEDSKYPSFVTDFMIY